MSDTCKHCGVDHIPNVRCWDAMRQKLTEFQEENVEYQQWIISTEKQVTDALARAEKAERERDGWKLACETAGKVARDNEAERDALRRQVGVLANAGGYTDIMRGAISSVREERYRQDEKWGEQNHEHVMWFAILMEEVGEACKEALTLAFPPKKQTGPEWQCGSTEEYLEFVSGKYRSELVQVSAVALAMIECYDRKALAEARKETGETK